MFYDFTAHVPDPGSQHRLHPSTAGLELMGKNLQGHRYCCVPCSERTYTASSLPQLFCKPCMMVLLCPSLEYPEGSVFSQGFPQEYILLQELTRVAYTICTVMAIDT